MKKYKVIQYCQSKKPKFNENYFGNNNFIILCILSLTFIELATNQLVFQVPRRARSSHLHVD